MTKESSLRRKKKKVDHIKTQTTIGCFAFEEKKKKKAHYNMSMHIYLLIKERYREYVTFFIYYY